MFFPLCLVYHNSLHLPHEKRLYNTGLNTGTTFLLGHTSVICLEKQILEISKLFFNWSQLQGWPANLTQVFTELNNSSRRSFHNKLLTKAEMSSSTSLGLCKLGFQANPQAKTASCWLLELLSDPTPWRVGGLQTPEHSGQGRAWIARLQAATSFQLIQYLQKTTKFFEIQGSILLL